MPSKTPEEISASIAKATAEFQQKKQAEKIQKDRLKAGVQYMHENKPPIYNFSYGDYEIYMAWRTYCRTYEEYPNHIRFAFSYVSPKDEYNPKITKGLLGSRLLTFYSNDVNFISACVGLEVIVKMTQKEIASLGVALHLEHSLINSSFIPDCIKREARDEVNRFNLTKFDFHNLVEISRKK